MFVKGGTRTMQLQTSSQLHSCQMWRPGCIALFWTKRPRDTCRLWQWEPPSAKAERIGGRGGQSGLWRAHVAGLHQRSPFPTSLPPPRAAARPFAAVFLAGCSQRASWPPPSRALRAAPAASRGG